MKKIQKILNEVVEDILVKRRMIYEFGDVSAETTPQETYAPSSTTSQQLNPYIMVRGNDGDYSRSFLHPFRTLPGETGFDHDDSELGKIPDMGIHAGRSFDDVGRLIANNGGISVDGLTREHMEELKYHIKNYNLQRERIKPLDDELSKLTNLVNDKRTPPDQIQAAQSRMNDINNIRNGIYDSLQKSDARLRQFKYDVSRDRFHNGLGGVNGPEDTTPLKPRPGVQVKPRPEVQSHASSDGDSRNNVSSGSQVSGNDTRQSSNNSGWGNGFTPGPVSAPHVGGIFDQFSKNPGISTLTAPNGVEFTREGANNVHAAIGSIPQIENQMEELQRQANMHKSTIMRIQGGGEGTYQDMMNAQRKLQELGEQHASLQQQLANHQKTLSDHGVDRRGNFIPQQKNAFQNNPLLVGGLAAGGLVAGAAGINALMNRRKK